MWKSVSWPFGHVHNITLANDKANVRGLNLLNAVLVIPTGFAVLCPRLRLHGLAGGGGGEVEARVREALSPSGV